MAGRGRGKTLPAWMTNGDATLPASIGSSSTAAVAGQFSDARETFKAPEMQAPVGTSGMGRDSFSSQSNASIFAPSVSREQYQQPPQQGQNKFPTQGGPIPPQGPYPRGVPGQYNMPSNPSFAPPRPMMQGQMGQGGSHGQEYNHSGQGNGVNNNGMATGMMGYQQQRPPMQQHQQQQYSSGQYSSQPQQPTMPQQQQQQMPYQQQHMQQQQPQQLNPAMAGMSTSIPGSALGLGLGPPVFQVPGAAALGLGRGMPFLAAPGTLAAPGLGLGQGLGSFPQSMGRGFPLGVAPRGPAPAPAPVAVGDPNNEVSSWSEHEAEDKRKYWYNRVTGTSTYDKPFCLKTPEERSIPPCKWKEYTSGDGKKYYSDGKESR